MAWRRIGDKPLSESMLTQFTDAYMRHKGDELSNGSADLSLCETKFLPKYSSLISPQLQMFYVSINTVLIELSDPTPVSAILNVQFSSTF